MFGEPRAVGYQQVRHPLFSANSSLWNEPPRRIRRSSRPTVDRTLDCKTDQVARSRSSSLLGTSRRRPIITVLRRPWPMSGYSVRRLMVRARQASSNVRASFGTVSSTESSPRVCRIVRWSRRSSSRIRGGHGRIQHDGSDPSDRRGGHDGTGNARDELEKYVSDIARNLVESSSFPSPYETRTMLISD